MKFAVFSALLTVALATPFFAPDVRTIDLRSEFVGRCDPGNRTDCGTYGTKQPECEAKGCCWSPADADDIPWCFYSSPPSPACSTTPPCSGHGDCTNGTCACSAGFATCGDVSVKDCSVNIGGDVENCGGCGQACPSGEGVASRGCDSGKCAVTCDQGYSLCWGECVSGGNCTAHGPFSEADMDTMVGYFVGNLDVQGEGGVMASPSTTAPDYYDHWQRDGAISMREFLKTRSLNETRSTVEHYTAWVAAAQFSDDPNGIDIRGEPKWYLDKQAHVYDKGWMRPQNDGCALRTITLIVYAQELMASQGDAGRQWVQQNVWTGDASKPGVQRDLEYITSQWNADSGDPWEEVRGQVFFVKHAMRRALRMGSLLASTFGDAASAAAYNATAELVEADIMSKHWNEAKGLLMEVPQTRELDSATHLAILYGDMDDGFLSPASPQLQSSVAQLIDAFQGYSDFSINAKDTAAGVPGLLVGRYLNDGYNGGNSSQPGGGNPWILCSASLAEIFYRAAALHAVSGEFTLTPLNARFLMHALDLSRGSQGLNGVGEATVVNRLLMSAAKVASSSNSASLHLSDQDEISAITRALTLSGDAILIRIKSHVAHTGLHLTEQINKDDGAPQGAQDLTWSYGTVIGAMAARDAAVRALL